MSADYHRAKESLDRIEAADKARSAPIDADTGQSVPVDRVGAPVEPSTPTGPPP